MYNSICNLIYLEILFLEARSCARGSRERGGMLTAVGSGGRVGQYRVLGSAKGSSDCPWVALLVLRSSSHLILQIKTMVTKLGKSPMN